MGKKKNDKVQDIENRNKKGKDSVNTKNNDKGKKKHIVLRFFLAMLLIIVAFVAGFLG